MKTGYTDRPAQTLKEDVFGIKSYIDGLSEYILVCNTPMTIAIQGDWGSGKTSIMNMVRNNIDKHCLCTWFNTWEYSQFNMSDELAISLLKSIVDTLNMNNQANNEALSNSLKVLGGSMKNGALMAIDAVAGGRVADTAERVIDGLTMKQVEHFESIKVLKTEFQDQINKALKNSKKAGLSFS